MGFESANKIRQERNQWFISRWLLWASKQVAQQIDQEVYSDYQSTAVAQQQIDLAVKADQEAQENLQFAEGRYSAGVGNIIELTDAELLAASAAAQVVTSRYTYQLAFGRLEVAAGKDPSD